MYGEEAMAHLKENGTVIYLKISYEEMVKRVFSDYRTRGVVLRGNQSPAEMYADRCVLYEKYADIDWDNLTDREAAEYNHALYTFIQTDINTGNTNFIAQEPFRYILPFLTYDGGTRLRKQTSIL